MAVKKKQRTPAKTYLNLVNQFPLAHIRDDDHLDAAQRMIDRLLKKILDSGAQEYLDALTDLVEAFDNEHVPIPDASEADVLRERMHSNKLNQGRLARITGIAQSTLSAVLNGNRTLTNHPRACPGQEEVSTARQFYPRSDRSFVRAAGFRGRRRRGLRC